MGWLFSPFVPAESFSGGNWHDPHDGQDSHPLPCRGQPHTKRRRDPAEAGGSYCPREPKRALLTHHTLSNCCSPSGASTSATPYLTALTAEAAECGDALLPQTCWLALAAYGGLAAAAAGLLLQVAPPLPTLLLPTGRTPRTSSGSHSSTSSHASGFLLPATMTTTPRHPPAAAAAAHPHGALPTLRAAATAEALAFNSYAPQPRLVPLDWLHACCKDLGATSPATVALALHCWRRLSAAPTLSPLLPRAWPDVQHIYMAVCVWLAAKLEEPRHYVPRASAVGCGLGASAATLCELELQVLALLDWSPYRGFTMEEDPLVFL